MKKNFKKLSSLALAFLLVFSLSVSALAAGVSADQAKQVALKNAGYSSSQVSRLYAELDYDDGVKFYDVSFVVANADGSYYEFDYDVRASDGKILEKDVEKEYAKSQVKAQSAAQPEAKAQQAAVKGKEVDEAQAKKAALAYFGLNENDVRFLEVRKEYEDGVQVYSLEFCKPYSEKFSCDVVVANGAVRDVEREAVRGLADKFELFLELFFASLFG